MSGWPMKVWTWIKAHWKLLLSVAGVVAGVLMAVRVVGVVRGILARAVDRPGKFKRLDDTHVAVRTETGWKSVDVGALGLKSRDVAEVEYVIGGPVKVVKHNANIDDI